ncbi:50S ribosomal protein L5 [Candidatus Micrarchaeota archaeon]|nr:50S ribosomal protein L5 [Candidatus Micrarchaeota archaeon]MBU1930743.1 50S ribosomal protein L5 [Candidatus Micrarchaeota archaeon]
MKQSMKAIRVGKVTINMGVGAPGDELERAQTIMKQIVGTKGIQTKAKVRLPTWEIRPGLPIGVKVTLRKQKAVDFLKRALTAKENCLKKSCFDGRGNFGFGIPEYIDLPEIKYDPQLGVRGLDVLVSLERPGYRISKRKQCKTKIGMKQVISKEKAMQFMTEEFGVTLDG